jgi:hypothetical protein
VIYSLDPGTRIIVVDDARYHLSPLLRVYTYDSAIQDPQAMRAEDRLKDSHALSEGMRIGFNVTGEGAGQRGAITEAWILPAGSGSTLNQKGKSAGTPATGKNQSIQPGR